jgi:hypothetical protein
MDTSGHLRISESGTRRLPKGKATPRGERRPGAGKIAKPERSAAGTLSRTKSVLLAPLRVWEWKRRID